MSKAHSVSAFVPRTLSVATVGLFRIGVLALFLLSLAGFSLGCGEGEKEEEPAEEKPEEQGEKQSDDDGQPDEGDPVSSQPAPDPGFFAPYKAYVPADTWAVAVMHPERLVAAASNEIKALESALPDRASAFEGALTESLSAIAGLTDAAAWVDGGLDPARPMVVFGWTGGEQTLDAVFGEVSKDKLAGITKIEDLVYALGESQDSGADAAVVEKQEALVSTLNGFGRGWRVVVPASDGEKAVTTIKGLLSDSGFSEAEAGSADAALESDSGWRVQITSRDDFIVVDTASYPGWKGNPEKHLELSRGLLAEISTASTGIPVGFDEEQIAYGAIDVQSFGKMTFIGLLQANMVKLDELRGFKRGRRAEPGNAMLDELEQLRYTVYMLDPMLRAGPFSWFTGSVFFESGRVRMVTRGHLSEEQAALEGGQKGLGADLSGAFLTVDLSPMVASSRGAWSDSGLAAPEWVKLDSLYKAAELDQLPWWFNQLPALGLWTWPLPSAAWRDLASDSYATLDPLEVERVQMAVGMGGGTDAAMILTDKGGDIALYQKALACAAAGAVADCDPSAVKLDSTSKLTVNGWPYTYKMMATEDSARVVIGGSTEMVDAVSSAEAMERSGAMSATVDLEALSNAALPEVAQQASKSLSSWVKGIEVTLVANPDQLVWTTVVSTDYPALVSIGSIVGAGPSLPDADQLVSAALTRTFDTTPPKPKTTGGGGDTTTARKLPPNEAKAGVAKVFKTRTKEIERCYQRVIQKHGTRSGTIEVTVTINASGSVKSVRVTRDQIGLGMGNCVENAIERWRFPSMTEDLTIGKRWTLN